MKASRGFWSGLAAVVGFIFPMATAGATAVTVGSHYMESSQRHSNSPPTTTNCSNVLICYMIFNVVPAGKQLVISNLNCRVGVTGPTADTLSVVNLLTYASTGPTDRESNLPPVKIISNAPTHQFYNISGTVYHLFKAGERPVVRLVMSGANGVVASCSISGKVGNPPD